MDPPSTPSSFVCLFRSRCSGALPLPQGFLILHVRCYTVDASKVMCYDWKVNFQEIGGFRASPEFLYMI